MRKVLFITNLDNYKGYMLPENITIPPRTGETVLVKENFLQYFADKNLTMRLKVVDVI